MISTVAMIRLGYIKGNRMTNVKPSNIKLKERSFRMLMAETGLDVTAANALLNNAGGDFRVALVMFGGNATRELALAALNKNDFVIEKAIVSIRK